MFRLQRRLRVPYSRLQYSSAPSATSAAVLNSDGSTPSSSTKDSDENPPKYKPGWFSRNPGVTLGGILLGIGLYIYRGSRNKKNFEALQNPIAEAAVISPYEAWELRSSNNITPATFEDVRNDVMKTFPSGKASMQHFDQYLGFKLAQACPTGMKKSYHLERVLLSLETDRDRKSDIDAQMVALSMAVKGTVDERLRILFNLATNAPAGEALNVPEKEQEENDTREISQEQLERLLHLLLQTYQIPSEKRVLAVEDAKYPFQEYKVATPSDMLKAAVQAQVKDKKMTEEEAGGDQKFVFEAFSQIMRSKTVCLWGECFSNSKMKMKN